MIRSDGLGYHAWTRAWLDRDLSFCDLYDDSNWPVEIPAGESGRCAVSYPPGLALIRFPVMAGFTAANGGELRSGPEDVVVQLFGVLGVLVAVVGTVAAARRLGSSWLAANVAAIAVVFGTGMFHYATFDAGFAHGWISAFVAVLALLTVWIPGVIPDDGDADRDRPGPVATGSWFVVPWILMLLRQTSLLIIVGVLSVVAVMLWRRDGLCAAVRTLRRPYLVAVAGVAVAVVG